MSNFFEQRAKRENTIADLTGRSYYNNSSGNFIVSRLKKKKGNLTPLEHFIFSNLKVINLMARRFVSSRVPMNELTAVGVEALIKCFNKYNADKGAISGSFVQRAIFWALRTYSLKNKSALSVPSNPSRAKNYELACDPVNTVSIDAIEKDDCSSFTPAVDDERFDFSDAQLLRRQINKLCPEERIAVELYYFKGQNFAQIDKVLGRFGAADYRLGMARKKIRDYYKRKNIIVEF